MTKIVLNTIDYLDNAITGDSTIYIWGRAVDNPLRRVMVPIKGFRPYFYTEPRAPVYFHEILSYEKIKDLSKIKVVTKFPYDVRILRRTLESKFYLTWEADILYVYRFLIDSGIMSTLELIPESGKTRIMPIFESLPSNLRVLFLDIEIWARKVIDCGSYSEPVILCTIYDSIDKKYYIFYLNSYKYRGKEVWNLDNLILPNLPDAIFIKCANEKIFLTKIANFIKKKDPDVISGYNIDFDMTSLYTAMIRNHVKPDVMSPIGKVIKLKGGRKRKLGDVMLKSKAVKIYGRNIIDLQESYFTVHFSGTDEMGLDYIAKEEKVGQKYPLAEPIYSSWIHNPIETIKYNKQDVTLCLELDKKLKLIAFLDEKRKLVGAMIPDALSAKKLLDLFMLRKAHQRGEILPSAKAKGEKYKGAVVIDPKMGHYGWLCLCDYKALYPTIIMSLNMDPDGFWNIPREDIEQYKIDDVHYFRKTPKGLTPIVLEDLILKRAEKVKLQKEALAKKDYDLFDLYKLQEDSVKVLANASYGIFGYRFRRGSKETIESVTIIGRDLLTFAAKVIESTGRTVIYGDTDSIFWIPLTNDPESIRQEMEEIRHMVEQAIPNLLKKYNFNAPSPFKFEAKTIYDSFFILDKKKRYAGHVVWDAKKGIIKRGDRSEWNIMGLESKRSDSSHFSKKLQNFVIKSILNKMPKADLQAEVEKRLDSFPSLPLIEIGVPSAISKEFKDYKGNPIQKRSSMYSNEHLGTYFLPGLKPKRIYILYSKDEKKYPDTDVVSIDWNTTVPPELIIDYPRMMEQTVRKKIEKLLAIIGVAWNDLKLDGDLAITQEVKSIGTLRYRGIMKANRICSQCHNQFPYNDLSVTKTVKCSQNIDDLIIKCITCKGVKKKKNVAGKVSTPPVQGEKNGVEQTRAER